MTAPQDEPVAEVVMSMSPRLPGEHGKYFSWLSNPSDIPADTKLYAQSPAAVRAAAIAECARVCEELTDAAKRKKSRGASGQVLGLYEGTATECLAAIKSMSPCPRVTKQWIDEIVTDTDNGQIPAGQIFSASDYIRAALQSLGYEVTK